MKKQISIIVLALTSIMSAAFVIKSSNGIAGQTGSPGEGQCNQCHSGGSSTSSSITISSAPSFTANEFIQGQTYTITVTVAASSFSNFGFGCEILNAGNTNSGTMQNPGAGVKFLTAGNGRKNAVHTTAKAGNGNVSFTFEWIAPSNGDNARIFVGANAVNLNGNTSGDFPFSTSLVLAPQISASVKEQNSLNMKFSFYPNPTKDIVNVSYQLNEQSDIDVSILSIDGKVVSKLMNLKENEGLHTKTLRLPSTLPSGVYFIRLETNGQQTAQRLISIL